METLIQENDISRHTRALAGPQCPLCGNRQEQATGNRWVGQDGILLWQCCETLLAWAWPSVAAYENHYEVDEYHRDACVAMGLPTQYERFEEHRRADLCRIAYLSRWFDWPRTTVLDVGASNGAFVYASTHDIPCAGALGIEPNANIAQWTSQAHGIAIQVGNWNDIQKCWDLIVATDIVEHLTDPSGFFLKAHAHSNYLYLETPDWSPQRPRDWKHIKPYEHICLYSASALQELASRCGWNIRDIYRPIEGKLAMLLVRDIPYSE